MQASLDINSLTQKFEEIDERKIIGGFSWLRKIKYTNMQTRLYASTSAVLILKLRKLLNNNRLIVFYFRLDNSLLEIG